MPAKGDFRTNAKDCAALPRLSLLPMMPPPRGVVQVIGLQRGFGK